MGLTTLAALVGGGCGGDSNPTQPTPIAAPAPTPALVPTLSSIQANVFSTRCTACHSGATPEAGLQLTAGAAYTSLVNVASSQRSLMRVAPNDSANSYLIHKIEGRGDILGHQMPPPPALPGDVVQVIRQWIDRGAPNN